MVNTENLRLFGLTVSAASKFCGEELERADVALDLLQDKTVSTTLGPVQADRPSIKSTTLFVRTQEALKHNSPR